MKRNSVLTISMLLMLVLGIIIIILGFTAGSKVLIPPIITGIGFIIIAWVFEALKEK